MSDLPFGGTDCALPMLWAVFLFLIGAGGRYGKRALALEVRPKVPKRQRRP